MIYDQLCDLHEQNHLALPCPRCFDLYMQGDLRPDQILPLRGGALDAISRLIPSQKICQRCERMEMLITVAKLDEELALAPVITDWQEAIRLPAEIKIGWGVTRYPTGGFEAWIEYQLKCQACIPFYQEPEDEDGDEG